MRIGLMAGVVGAVLGLGGSMALGGGNAALSYYRAWSVMGDTREELIDTRGDEIALAEGVDSVVGRYGTALEHLVRASGMEGADWGIDLADGPGTLLPHLGQIRQSARLVAAAALEHAEDGELGEASKCVAALHGMSVHSSSGDTLICSLVGIAIGNLGIELTNQMLDDGLIRADGARVVLEAIERGGESDRYGVRDAIVGEWRMMSEFIVRNVPEEDAGAWLMEQTMFAEDPPAAKRVLEMDRGELVRELGGFAEYHSDLLVAWDAQDKAMFEAAEARVQDGAYGPLTELLGATMLRSFQSDMDARQQLRALIERLEEVAD